MTASRCAAARSTRASRSSALHSPRLMRETWNCMLNLLAKVVHRRLLRARRERPRSRRAAEQRDESTSSHIATLAHYCVSRCASQQSWQRDFRLGSTSTELAKPTSPFMSAMPQIATHPVCHIELSRDANSRHMHRIKKSTAIRSLRRRQRAGNAEADLRCLRCGWQFLEEGLRVGQVRRTAPCVEEPIDVPQAGMRLRMPTLIGQDTGEARCRAQFERS